MSVNKQYIEMLQQQGFISDVIYYENDEVLRIISLLAEKSEEWKAVGMFMEAPILIDKDEDNIRLIRKIGYKLKLLKRFVDWIPLTIFKILMRFGWAHFWFRIDKANRIRIKKLLKEKDENLFQAYQKNKMRKNFVVNILALFSFLIDENHQSRFQELRTQFTGSSDPTCFSPRIYEYLMSNQQKRDFMSSFISLIEDVAKSSITGQQTM